MIKTSCQKRTSECGRATVIIHNDMPLGEYHDFLMEEKAWTVEVMMKAHKEQEEQAKAMKSCDSQESCQNEEL